MSTTTVIKCLSTLFSLFGMPAYIHSDRGTTFMSEELRTFLTERGVATSRTTSFNFFGFPQRSSVGSSIPSWLLQPGPVFIKRQVHSSKYDPLVDEVELLQANLHYAHVHYSDGRETTVVIKHLAPRGKEMTCQPSVTRNDNSGLIPESPGSHIEDTADEPRDNGRPNVEHGESTQNEHSPSMERQGMSQPAEENAAESRLRRSTRTRRPFVNRHNL